MLSTTVYISPDYCNRNKMVVVCSMGLSGESRGTARFRDESKCLMSREERPDVSSKLRLTSMIVCIRLILAGDVELNPGPLTDLDSIVKSLQDVLKANYSLLHDITKSSLPAISRDMYAEGILSESLRDSPTYNGVMGEFEVRMEIIDNEAELRQHCETFISILSKRGHQDIASYLVKKWNEEIKKHMKVDAFFKVQPKKSTAGATSNEKSPTKLELEQEAACKSNDSMSREEMIFREHCEDMMPLLLHSLSKLTRLAAQEELISYDLMEAVFNKEVDFQKQSRASLLVSILRRKIDRKAGNPQLVIKGFFESIEELRDMHKYLSDEYNMKKKNNVALPERRLILENGDRIATMLEFNIQPVASRLKQSGTVTSEEYNMIINPHEKHDQAAIAQVMENIGKSIGQNKENMKKFIEILDDIGGPVRHLADMLRRA